MKKSFLTLNLIFAACLGLFAQPAVDNRELYRIHIRKTGEKIAIDGDLSEEVWKSAEIAGDFWQKWPRDDVKAHLQTQVQMTWDDDFLYLAATLFDTGKHVIQTLKRDIDFWDSDGFSVVLDPVNERTYGFLFGVNAAGVQTEGLLQVFEEPGMEWDNRWFSAVKQYPDRWTLEIAIPFKTLRYAEGKTTWGINFIRNDIKNYQYHTWAKVPLQYMGVDFGYMGALVWDEAPKRSRGNIAFIPYVTGSLSSDYEEKTPADLKGNGGADAKIALSSSLNLDLTVNPDFSQIEVDQQVTNLTRFDIFFPERRTFFLENSDLFAGFGLPPVRPFFSRTIGLDEDGKPVPILFGARLSGNLDKNWRIGIMDMQTGEKNEEPAQNYFAAAFQRKLFQRSNIKAMLLNRQAFNGVEPRHDNFNRNVDVEFTYQNAAGDWTAWTGYHKSFQPNVKGKDDFYNIGFWHNGRKFYTVADLLHMGTNYTADMGFVQRIENYDAERDTFIRVGYNHIFNEAGFNMFPKNSKSVNVHGVRLETFIVYNPDGTFNERFNNLRYYIEFKNSSELSFLTENNLVKLLFPFSFTGDTPLPAARYNSYRLHLEYESDTRKPFSWGAGAGYSPAFYSGDLILLGMGVKYRAQPWGNFNLDIEYNHLRLPDPYGQGTLLLIQPRIEINFSRSIFWTTFLQLNTQSENFNINSRLQWRFAPMSDLFIVYTDNYFSETENFNGRFRLTHFAPRNRALVFKLNYWLSL
jgi:hypothetical protein